MVPGTSLRTPPPAKWNFAPKGVPKWEFWNEIIASLTN
jgi:hypothetical protein